MQKAKRILVIGGGIGGLACAIAARRIGVDVDLVELKSDWKVFHVGMIVQGNCLRALSQLGIVEQVVAAGFPQSGVAFQDLHGNDLFRIQGAPLAPLPCPTDLAITRPALHEVLTRNAMQLGVQVRLGMTFQVLDTSGPKPQVQFTDGTEGAYDLVIGADGVHSRVRTSLFGEVHQARFTGQGVWRYNLPRPPEVERLTMLLGLRRGKCGFCPVRDDMGYVLLVQEEPDNPHHPADRLADIMRERLAPCGSWMGRLREQITDSTLVVYRPLEVVQLPPPWHKNGVLLIGDAAHATTPHLGQGAAQAIEDAVVVGELLAQGLAGDAIGAKFMERRYERLKFITEASIQIGVWELRDDPGKEAAALTRKMIEVVAQPI